MSSWTQSPSWIRAFKQVTNGTDAEHGTDDRAAMRGLIEEANPSDENRVQEYHDDEGSPSNRAVTNGTGGPITNGTSGPRVEPSSLVDIHDEGQWRNEGQGSR